MDCSKLAHSRLDSTQTPFGRSHTNCKELLSPTSRLLLSSNLATRFSVPYLGDDKAPKLKLGKSSFVSRNGNLITLSLLACSMFIFTSYFAHATANPPRHVQISHDHGPLPPLNLGSPSTSILVLQICTSMTTLLLTELSMACHERVRWHQAYTRRGVSGGMLLGLSRATSILGVCILLVCPGSSRSTRLWCLKRLAGYAIITLISFIFLLNLHFAPFYPICTGGYALMPGWGDFNSSLQQANPLGFSGFLSDTRSSFRIPPSADRCHTANTIDTTLENCTSYLIPTSLFYLGSVTDGAMSVTSRNTFSHQVAGISGLMPRIETPWALSFYPHAYNHTFTDEECGMWLAPYPSNFHTSWTNQDEIALKMCFNTLGDGLEGSTTILGQISICPGDDVSCYYAVNNGTSGFTGAGYDTQPFNVSMTVTKVRSNFSTNNL